jgi:hypothetical protein
MERPKRPRSTRVKAWTGVCARLFGPDDDRDDGE